MYALRQTSARLVAVFLLPAALGAQVFNGGLPAGYVCQGVPGAAGVCGVSPASGVVTLAPGGGSQFGYVTTDGSEYRLNPLAVTSSTNGSLLLSSPFTATAGQALSFRFNYVTSDGTDVFPDYAFVRLLGGTDPILLFTAQTTPSGNTVPGFGLPVIAPGVTLTPSATPVISTGYIPDPGGVGPVFGPLGFDSGTCFNLGCGYTGWIVANYVVPSADTYQLEFGVFNVTDELYASALAFDFASGSGGTPALDDVTAVPEPGSIVLLGTGLLGVLALTRRRRPRGSDPA
jgi:hypothetical protein